MSESFIDLKCNKSCRHIRELEQQLTELKESQKQKQIIRLCNRLDNAERQNKKLYEDMKYWESSSDYYREKCDKTEQQNKQMIEALKLIKHKLENDPAITDTIWIDDNPMCAETAVDRINCLLDIKE